MFAKTLKDKEFEIKLENTDIRFVSNIDNILSEYSFLKILRFSEITPEYFIQFYTYNNQEQEYNEMIGNYGDFFDAVIDHNITVKKTENNKIKYKKPQYVKKIIPQDNKTLSNNEICYEESTPFIKSSSNKSLNSLQNKQTSISERIIEIPVDLVKDSFSVSQPIKDNFNYEQTNDSPFIKKILFIVYILGLLYSFVLFFHLITIEYSTKIIFNVYEILLFLFLISNTYVCVKAIILLNDFINNIEELENICYNQWIIFFNTILLVLIIIVGYTESIVGPFFYLYLTKMTHFSLIISLFIFINVILFIANYSFINHYKRNSDLRTKLICY